MTLRFTQRKPVSSTLRLNETKEQPDHHLSQSLTLTPEWSAPTHLILTVSSASTWQRAVCSARAVYVHRGQMNYTSQEHQSCLNLKLWAASSEYLSTHSSLRLIKIRLWWQRSRGRGWNSAIVLWTTDMTVGTWQGLMITVVQTDCWWVPVSPAQTGPSGDETGLRSEITSVVCGPLPSTILFLCLLACSNHNSGMQYVRNTWRKSAPNVHLDSRRICLDLKVTLATNLGFIC